jgi:hypothetical protein
MIERTCGCTETTDCHRHERMAKGPVPAKDWKLLQVIDRGASNYYRYQVSGLNLNWRPEAPDYHFTWSVRTIDDPRYDVSEAVFTSAQVES